MRAAPAVSVHGSGGLPWRLTRTLLPTAAAAALSTWLLQHLQAQPFALTIAVAVSASSTAGCCWRLARAVAADLVFDGQRWTCDGREGRVAVMLDLDRFLLLRWTPADAGAPRWLAFTPAEAGAALHGLRVALYAPQPAEPAKPAATR